MDFSNVQYKLIISALNCHMLYSVLGIEQKHAWNSYWTENPVERDQSLKRVPYKSMKNNNVCKCESEENVEVALQFIPADWSSLVLIWNNWTSTE